MKKTASQILREGDFSNGNPYALLRLRSFLILGKRTLLGTPRFLMPLLVLLLILPAVAHAQFTYLTNNGMITITGYIGAGGAVTIPDTIDGLPVTSIGNVAFYNQGNLTNVTIPNSVTSIGTNAFSGCSSLSGVTIPNSVTSIRDFAFAGCFSLTNISLGNSITNIGKYTFSGSKLASVAIPNSLIRIGNNAFNGCHNLSDVSISHGVASIGTNAFAACTSLINITIPSTVTNVEFGVFVGCTNLTGVFFQGDAPSHGSYVFNNADKATIYHLPGTTGWGPTFDYSPTALWSLPNPVILTKSPSFGVRTNAFGFIISWATNVPVVVEACMNLAPPNWSSLTTNALTGGWFYFSDPEWVNHPSRIYRVRPQGF